MSDDHGRLLGNIETQVANLCERQERHYEANRSDHQGIRDDLGQHNDRVVALLATSKAEKKSGDEQHSRIWSIMLLAIGLAVGAFGGLYAIHIAG